MSKQKHVEKCSQCESDLFDQYCSNCGHPRKPKKIDGQYISGELRSILNFDRGIFFTVKELLLRPGISVRKFILDDRERLVKPVVFVIICSLVYTIAQHVFQFEDGYVGFSLGKDSATESISNWISENYGYANVLIALFIAFWIKFFFRKYSHNYFEILVLLSFVMGVGMLIFSFFGMVDSFVISEVIDKGFLVGVLYISWGIGQFFDRSKKINYLKAFLS